MAAIKFKSATGVERMYENGFGGISHTEQKGKCLLLQNFDHCADGSLKTRSGYTSVGEYSGEMRASFNFADKLYLVFGNLLIVTSLKGDTPTAEYQLGNADGEADIFCFGGDIFIHDGSTFYHLNDDELREVEGYAPLYGNAWHPTARGAISEEINLLSDRIRISYSVTPSTSKFKLGVKAASIDRVEINNEEIAVSDIIDRLDANDPSILYTVAIKAECTVTFWLTLHPDHSYADRLRQPTKAFVFGNNGGERLCLYNPGISCNLYSSRPVTRKEHTKSTATAKDALSLYIPASAALCIGSGASPITGMAHHYGRGILFTETDAWFIDWDGAEADSSVTKPKCFLLNSAIGAEHIHSSAYLDNDPITYFCGKLWRWHSQSGVRDECSASILSDEIADMIPNDSERISMLSLPQKQKIFISDADDPDGKILVYDLSQKAWTVYSGIFADRLFGYGNKPAFSRNGEIFVFLDELRKDLEADEQFTITSRLTTSQINFGCPEKSKRGANVILEYDLSGGEGQLILENENGERVTSIIRGKQGGGREQFIGKISLPRYKKLQLTLEVSTPAVIYSAIISAK